ncbi:hypothetical protein MTBSS4_110018 [Magnetospirillum sp. SS-4]|nr:hypothetical protein MTBSS4_110018 [Magnetospirillum sp. SS-4]
MSQSSFSIDGVLFFHSHISLSVIIFQASSAIASHSVFTHLHRSVPDIVAQASSPIVTHLSSAQALHLAHIISLQVGGLEEAFSTYHSGNKELFSLHLRR